MKGICNICRNDRFYNRLDMHQKNMHGNSTHQFGKGYESNSVIKDDEEKHQSKGNEEVKKPLPFYFFINEKFLNDKKAILPPHEREAIDIDQQSCRLAQYLCRNNINWWLKHNSNAFTLMSLTRMIHLMNNLHVAQPSCYPPLDIDQFHDDAMRQPMKMSRYAEFFAELDPIILHKFKSLFLKYSDLVQCLLKHYESAYK